MCKSATYFEKKITSKQQKDRIACCKVGIGMENSKLTVNRVQSNQFYSKFADVRKNIVNNTNMKLVQGIRKPMA